MFSKNSYGLEAMVKDRLHQKNSESPSLLPCFMQCEKLIENITDENEEQEYEEKEEKHSINNLNTNEYRTLALKHKFDIRRAVRTFKDDSFDNLSNLDKFLLCMLLNFFEEKHLKKHNLNVCDPEIADAENDENVNKLEEFNKNKAIVLNSVTNEFKEKVKQYIDNNQEAYHQKNLSLFIAKVKHPQSFDDLTFSNDFKNFCLFPLQQKVKRHRKKRKRP